jgi:hypothetical protein
VTLVADTVPSRLDRPWLPVLGVVLLAIAASISGIGNQFAQDDGALIWKNPLVHDLSRGLQFFGEPYWPKPFTPDLYRPLALLSFAIQWAIGGGEPLVFRIVSYLLYAVTCLAVFRIARITLPLAAGFTAAALFAVHPVHVEAVAMAVNQGELWITLLSCLAVYRYVKVRRAGDRIPLPTALGIGALYFIACFFKENALVLPGLLVAAELFLVPGRSASLMTRARQMAPLFLMMAVLAAVFLVIRTSVLGDVRGTAIAEAIRPLSMWERALTMFTVVPDWFRLLFWPNHLQADYSPQEIVGQTTWIPMARIGLTLLVIAAIAFFAAWRRAPVISFGILWCAIGLFPVHNVLVPTGIVLAERTLLLPSVGAMIALGGLGALLLERAEPGGRKGLAVIVAALLILGVFRSTSRHPVWIDQFTLWYETANVDAPLSFRAHHALAELYVTAKADGRAEPHYRMAIALAPPFVSTVYLDYANRLRLRGFCYPAVDLYRKSLAADSTSGPVRASLAACLINIGKYQEALAETAIGIASGEQVGTWQWLQRTADSAQRAGAPPGSVRPTVSIDTLKGQVMIGTTR